MPEEWRIHWLSEQHCLTNADWRGFQRFDQWQAGQTSVVCPPIIPLPPEAVNFERLRQWRSPKFWGKNFTDPRPNYPAASPAKALPGLALPPQTRPLLGPAAAMVEAWLDTNDRALAGGKAIGEALD